MYIYIKSYRAFKVLGEKVFVMKRSSIKRKVFILFSVKVNLSVSAVTKLLVIALYHTVTMD